MINDISQVWEAAAIVAWSNSSLCLANSTNNAPSGLSEGDDTTLAGSSGCHSPSPTVSGVCPTPSNSRLRKLAIVWAGVAKAAIAGVAVLLEGWAIRWLSKSDP